MFKPSLTVHKSDKGELSVLVCSEDAGEAIAAYRECENPGEVQLIIRGHYSKHKKIKAGPEPVKKVAKKATKKKETE
jgi:hypothetical protein